MARRKRKTGRISVFKGRTRQLTKAIFWILAQRAPSTAYDMYKEVRKRRRLKHTRYPVVNHRVRKLEELGYVEKIGTRKAKAGLRAPLYQLASKAYLAIILDQINLDNFIEEADEVEILTALGIFSHTVRYMSVFR